MTPEGLGEMFEGDSADRCGKKIPLLWIGGRAEGLASADPGARTPIITSGNFSNVLNQVDTTVYFLLAVLSPVSMHYIVRYQKENSDINHA